MRIYDVHLRVPGNLLGAVLEAVPSHIQPKITPVAEIKSNRAPRSNLTTGYGLLLTWIYSMDRIVTNAEIQHKWGELGYQKASASTTTTRMLKDKLIERTSTGCYRLAEKGITFVNQQSVLSKSPKVRGLSTAEVLQLFDTKPQLTVGDAVAALKITTKAAQSRFARLVVTGQIKRVGVGVYERVEDIAEEMPKEKVDA